MASNQDSLIGLGIVVKGMDQLREFEERLRSAAKTKKGHADLIYELKTKGFEKGIKQARQLADSTARTTEVNNRDFDAFRKAKREEKAATDATARRTHEIRKGTAAVREAARVIGPPVAERQRRAQTTRATRAVNAIIGTEQAGILTAAIRATPTGKRIGRASDVALGVHGRAESLLDNLTPIVRGRGKGQLDLPLTGTGPRVAREVGILQRSNFGEKLTDLTKTLQKNPKLLTQIRDRTNVQSAIGGRDPDLNINKFVKALQSPFFLRDLGAGQFGGKDIGLRDLNRILEVISRGGVQKAKADLKEGAGFKGNMESKLKAEAKQTKSIIRQNEVGAVSPRLLAKVGLTGAGAVVGGLAGGPIGAIAGGLAVPAIGAVIDGIRSGNKKNKQKLAGLKQEEAESQRIIDDFKRQEISPGISAIDRETITAARIRKQEQLAEQVSVRKATTGVRGRVGRGASRITDFAFGEGSSQRAFGGPKGEGPREPIIKRFLPGTNKRFRGFGTAVRTVAQFAGASAIVFQLANSLRDAVTNAIQFEDAMKRIQGVLATRSLSEALKIEEGIIHGARQYGIELLEVAKAAEIFAQQGLRAQEIVRELNATLSAVRGAGLSISQAKELLTAVRNVTNEEVKSLEILDRISRVSARRAIESGALAEALQAAGPIARQLRGDIVGITDELDIVIAATTTVVERTRVTGKQAATSLKFVLSRLGRPQVLKSLQDIGGVELGTADSGGLAFRPLLEILFELSEAFEKLQGTAKATQFAVALGGARQVVATTALLGNFSAFLDTARLSSVAFGDIQERVAIQMDTVSVRLAKLRNEVRIFGLELVNSSTSGQVFVTLLDKLIESFRDFNQGSGAAELKLGLLIVKLFLFSKALGAVALGFKTIALTSTLTGALQNAKGLNLLTRSVVKLFSGLGRANPLKLFGKLLQGIGAFLGPGAAVVVGIVAITAATIGLFKAFGKLKSAVPDNPLFINFNRPEDLNLFDVPNFKEFSENAERFGVSNPELFDTVKRSVVDLLEVIRSAVGEDFEFGPSLIENLRMIQSETGLTRKALIENFIEIMDEKMPGFAARFEELGFGIADAMQLISQAAFLGNAQLDANLNRFTDTMNSSITDVTNSVGQLGELRKELEEIKFVFPSLDVSRFLTGSGRAFAIEDRIRLGKKQALAQFQREITPKLEFGDTTQKLFDLLLQTSVPSLDGASVFDAAISGLAGQEITGSEILSRISEVLQGFSEEDFEALAQVLQRPVQDALGVTGPRVGTGTLTEGLVPVVGISDAFANVMGRVSINIRNALGDELNEGNENLLTLANILELVGAKAPLTFGAILSSIVKIKSPITDFLLDFVKASQILDATAAAAKRLGNTFDPIEAGFKITNEFATRLFTVEAETSDQLFRKITDLERIIRLSKQIPTDLATGASQFEQSIRGLIQLGEGELNIVAAQDISRGRIGELAALEFATEGQKTVFDLTAQIQRQVQLLNEIFGADGIGVLGDFLGDIGADSIAVVNTALLKFLESAGQLQLILPGMTGTVNDLTNAQRFAALAAADLGNFFAAFGEANDRQVEKLNRHRDALASFALTATVATEAAAAQNKVSLETVNLQTKLQSLGLPTQLATQFELRAIQARRGLTEDLASKQFGTAKVGLIARRDIGDLGTGVDFAAELRKLETTRDTAIEKAKIVQLTETELALLRQIFEVETSIVTRTRENATNRLSGLKTLLTDFDALTSRDFFATGFGSIGQDLIERQADIFLEQLFDPSTGLFAGLGEALGIAGEFKAITDAHIIGATRGGAILEAAIRRGLSGAPPGAPGGTPGGEEGISQLQSILRAGATIGGGIFGTALGGGGKSAQTGSQFGTLGGTLIGAAIGGPLAPVIAPLLGGIIGGLIGGEFDEDDKPELRALQIIARNTGEQITLLENTNKLLDPERVSFNLPTSFTLPGFAPGNLLGGSGVPNAGGVNNSNVRLEISVTTSDPSSIGAAIADSVAQELSTQFSGSGTFVPRTGF